MPVPQPLPPIADKLLSVVLLADNAAHVEPVVAAWTQYLDARGQEYELLLVEDGLDGSADRALALTASHPHLRVLRHDAPRGEGAALRTALAEAKHPLLFYTLCQREYRPEFLGLLLDKPVAPPGQGMEIDHVHLRTGYRAALPVPSPLRVLGFLWRAFCFVVFSYFPSPLPGWLGWRGHAGRLAARILFGIRFHDVACPVRLIRREIFARIPIQSDSRFVHVEILAKANFLGCLMGEEVPLPVAPRPYAGDFGQLWRDGKRMFRHPDFGPAAPPVPPPVDAAARIVTP